VEIADANSIVVIKLSQKGMARISKSMPIEIFKDNNFTKMKVWIVLTG
jgi:hypothetical protein